MLTIASKHAHFASSRGHSAGIDVFTVFKAAGLKYRQRRIAMHVPSCTSQKSPDTSCHACHGIIRAVGGRYGPLPYDGFIRWSPFARSSWSPPTPAPVRAWHMSMVPCELPCNLNPKALTTRRADDHMVPNTIIITDEFCNICTHGIAVQAVGGRISPRERRPCNNLVSWFV